MSTLGIEADRCDGGAAQPLEELGRCAAAAIGVAAAEHGEAGFAEAGSGLGGRVVVEERQGDGGTEPGEDGVGAWPVRLEQRVELVGGSGAGGDVVVAHPHQRLELTGDRVEWSQTPKAVSVSAKVVGQHVAVGGVGLRSPSSPAEPRGMERIRVHRHDWVPSGKQAFDDDPIGSLDRYRQISRRSQRRQITEEAVKAGFVVIDREPGPDRAGVVENGDIVVLAGPIPTDVHAVSSLIVCCRRWRGRAGFSLFGLREASPWRRSEDLGEHRE